MLAGFELALFLWTPLIKDHASLPSTIVQRIMRFANTLTERLQSGVATHLDCFRNGPFPWFYLHSYHSPMKIATITTLLI